MDAYVTEEQQVEALKNWWKKNGSAILGIAAIGSILAFGFKYYTHHQEVVSEEASFAYNTMLRGVQDGDKATISKQADNLINSYAKTPYASMAALFLARQSVEANDLDGAIKHLTWCVEHTKVDDLRLIAEGRLARVMAAKGDVDKAISLVDNTKDKNGFLSLMQELKGDFLADEKKFDEAKAAYATALKTIGSDDKRPFLKLKHDDIGAAKSAELNVRKDATNEADSEVSNKANKESGKTTTLEVEKAAEVKKGKDDVKGDKDA